MGSGKGKKRKHAAAAAAPSRRSERLARREKRANDAAKTDEERDVNAEAKVFKKDSLTRALILRHKLILEKLIRTDKDIREAVKRWYQNPVAAERWFGHISEWDVSRVTDMSKLFRGCHSLNEDLSRWQTGKVTDMSWMFAGAMSFNSDLSQWQTGKVTDMSYMFLRARTFTSDLSKWQTGNVTDIGMIAMFHNATSLQEEPSWYTSNPYA